MSLYALDTHPLIFYANRVHRQLSRRVREVFEQAERKEALLLVPAPALWEVSMLEKVGQIKLRFIQPPELRVRAARRRNHF
jgi:PIN domain nuclease of toxin-antitoxin system